MICWGDTVAEFALLQLLVCLPIHLSLPGSKQERGKTLSAHKNGDSLERMNWLAFGQLATCFAIYGFIVAAMAVHVIPILKSHGLDTASALALAGLTGPMQAVGRAIDLWLAGWWTARRIGTITLGVMPLSIVALWPTQRRPELGIAFAVTYGLRSYP